MSQKSMHNGQEIVNNGHSISVAGFPNTFKAYEEARLFASKVEHYKGRQIGDDGRIFTVKGFPQHFYSLECAKKFIDTL